MTIQNLLDKYRIPLMAPPDDRAAAAADAVVGDGKTGDGAAGDGATGDRSADRGTGDGDGKTEKKSLRETLRDNFAAAGNESDEDREARRAADAAKRADDKTGEVKDGATGDGKTDDEAARKAAEAAERDKKINALPASLGKDEAAKAEWEKTPAAIKAAIHRREEEMAKGVQEIKDKYAEVDKALEPYGEAIRRNGHTPGAAVRQLFAWMDALTKNPKVAFPALAQSFNFDLKTLYPDAAAAVVATDAAKMGDGKTADPAAAAAAAAAAITPAQLPKEITDLLTGLKTQVDTLTSAQQAQLRKDTELAVTSWAKDKQFFEKVRAEMGKMIESGMVPTTQSGLVDLDWAYERAIWSNPEIRKEVLEAENKRKDEEAKAQREKEAKAQREQADKSRRASGGSLAPSAPGANNGRGPAPKKGASVGESLRAAVAALREK